MDRETERIIAEEFDSRFKGKAKDCSLAACKLYRAAQELGPAHELQAMQSIMLAFAGTLFKEGYIIIKERIKK